MNGPDNASSIRCQSISARPPARLAYRVEAPWTGIRLNVACDTDRPMRAHRINRYLFHIATQRCPRAAGKADDPGLRISRPNAGNNSTRPVDAPALEFLRCQCAAPGVENMHIRTRRNLMGQVVDRRHNQDDGSQGREGHWILVGKEPGGCLDRRTTPSAHACCNRPRRTAEPEQRDLRIKLLSHQPDGFEYRGKNITIGDLGKPVPRSMHGAHRPSLRQK